MVLEPWMRSAGVSSVGIGKGRRIPTREGVTEESEENQAQGTAPEVFVTGALAVWHRGHRLLWGNGFAGEIKSDG